MKIVRASWMLAISAFVCLLLAIFHSPFTNLVLGTSYSDSADVLAILAIATIPAIVNQPCGAFLQAINHDKLVGFTVGAAVVLQLLLVLVMGIHFGSIGAAFAFLAMQLLIFSIFFFRIFRYILATKKGERY